MISMTKYFDTFVKAAIKNRKHLDVYLKASEKFTQEQKNELQSLWDNHVSSFETVFKDIEEDNKEFVKPVKKTKKENTEEE